MSANSTAVAASLARANRKARGARRRINPVRRCSTLPASLAQSDFTDIAVSIRYQYVKGIDISLRQKKTRAGADLTPPRLAVCLTT
jgi:hypothetical protein